MFSLMGKNSAFHVRVYLGSTLSSASGLQLHANADAGGSSAGLSNWVLASYVGDPD